MIKSKWRSALCFLLVLTMLFTVSSQQVYGFFDFRSPTLNRTEDKVRFTTSLTGELADSLEILGVTILPLKKSGNVGYNPSDTYSKKNDLGSLIHIYVKNKSNAPIYPQVTFNGKTASDLLDLNNNTVSWASTPDTRSNRKYDLERPGEDGNINGFRPFSPLSVHIPAGAIDCYSINICDAKLLYNGIELEISAGGKSASAMLYGDYQYVTVKRLMWRSSQSNRFYPDEVLYYIDNASKQATTINYIRLYDGTEDFTQHYWRDAAAPRATGNGKTVITAGQPTRGTMRFTEPLAFKEYLMEFNITNGSRTYSIFQKTRPLVHEFDISVGWASGDLERLPYLKAISSSHFNTVIYNFGSSYQNYPQHIKDAYPIKAFGGVDNYTFGPYDNPAERVWSLDSVHAALPFGEPQLNDNANNYRVMGVYNKLQTYRNAPYATNITLSHEPFFYRYAGLSDLNHYDAYRVVAPFADAWYLYFKYAPQGKYGIYWGSPLETQGDYMRTLVELNYPNPVAAWTQGANSWSGARRFTDDPQYYYSPNPFELRLQAYENIANGAASLYWFNINTGDFLFFKDGSRETHYVNREISVVKEYLVHQVPYYYARSNNYDVNLNMCENNALMFVIDLNYAARRSMYQYNGMRPGQTFSFEVPEYLSGLRHVVKITKDGVSRINNAVFAGNTVTITDDVDMTAMYMLGDASLYNELQQNYNRVIAAETFDYLNDPDAYQELQASAGHSNDNPYIPKVYIDQGTLEYRVLYAFAGLIIHPLQRILTGVASRVYAVSRFFFSF